MTSRYPPWLDRGAYPFRSRWLELDAGRMHYVDQGQGHPLVLVHGNPAWSFLYRHVIRAVSHRFRCVAPDHLGFGLSDKPPGWSYRPVDHARNLAHLMDSLDLDGVTLVVQDWGGPIGLSWALEHLDRIRAIVVLNTWMWPVDDDPYYVAFSRIMGGGIGRYFIRRYNVFVRFVMKGVYGDPSRLTPHIHRHYLDPLDRPEHRLGCAAFPCEILGSTPWLSDLWERRRALRGIPSSIVWGMADKAFRERELERWTRALPEASVTRLEGVGHFVQEEAPDVLIRAILNTL